MVCFESKYCGEMDAIFSSVDNSCDWYVGEEEHCE